MNKRYGLTQLKLTTKSDDIKLHIYKMPVFDVEKATHENGKIVGQLKKQNNYQTIAFYNAYIASFEEIKNWNGVPNFDTYENRVIDILKSSERGVLERIILRRLEKNNECRSFGGVFFFELKECNKDFKDVLAKRVLEVDIQVNKEGDIYIGFEVSHRFFRKESILKKVLQGNIKEGTQVVDTQGKHYLYKGLSGETVSDENETLGRSILDYYRMQNRLREIRNIEPDTPAVLVKTKKNHNIVLSYAPQLLFEVCSFGQLPFGIKKSVNGYIKMNAQSKMNFALGLLLRILKNNQDWLQTCSIDKEKWIQYNMNTCFVDKQGYDVCQFQPPTLLFGNGKKETNVFSALRKWQVFGAKEKRTLKIHFFVEKNIVESFRNKTEIGKMIDNFIKKIKKGSLEMGIELIFMQSSKEIKDYTNVVFESGTDFKLKLKSIASQLKYPTIVVASKEGIEDCYEDLKKECARNNIPTQVVTTSTIEKDERGKSYALLNILLGIYAKAGIQSWVLAENMNSDCYIGLDVSHEEGRHATGIVQVVGKNGRVLDSGSMSSAEAGEIIRAETLREIVSNAVFVYEQEFNERPKHITIHRDGKGHNSEIESLKEIMNEYQIDFDYVSVIKDANRRMATYEEKKWETEIGLAYTKQNVAFLTATNPFDSIGMAKPIKITKLYGILELKDMVKDVFYLSYMHVGALNKARLPITIHYADLSSTYYNRGLIPSVSTKKELHFL